MKKSLLLFCSLFSITILLSSWGFYAHKKINRIAVFTLPSGMIRFYKNNIYYLSEHAVDPDKRRYADSTEGTRHFLDADHYGASPFDSIPKKWEDAVAKYSADTLNAYGTVPWQIERTYYRLVKAFQDKDSARILKISADIGHYISDAHVPLHATENYNGQLTGQRGIHAFWESRLPELFSEGYDYWVGKAKYIENPLNEAWKIIESSYRQKDSVFFIEKKLSEGFPPDKKYSFGLRNGKVDKQYSIEYSKKYHQALNGMIERQMRASIISTGSFWYTAWIAAGQPELLNFRKKEHPVAELSQRDKEEKLYQSGKILGRNDE
jgi:hypothetical protein